MSDDLVKRLRSPRNIFYEYAVDDGAFLREAADRIEELEAERDGWIETARMHHDAEAAFLKWLRAAGEHMRAEGVTVCDDGSDSGGILAAKVPACAALLQARAEAAEARIEQLENHIEGVAKDTHKIMVDLATPLDNPRVKALVDAAKEVKADCIVRADKNGVVPIGRGAWDQLTAALSALEENK